MALFNLYPIGEEAMDVRFGMIMARLEAGLPTVQVKRGKAAKLRAIFNRDFWTRPCSPEVLKGKIMTAFKALGMKDNKDG